jgi:hypothetical protein
MPGTFGPAFPATVLRGRTLPGYIAGTISIPSHQSRHAAAWFSGRQLVVALIFIAAVIVLLAGPVIAGALMDFFSSAAEKAAPTAFFLGLGLLFAGLIFRARVLDIAGACLIGLVLIGVVLDNYLLRRRRTCINSAGVQILGTVSVSHSTGTRLGIHSPRRARASARGYGVAGRAPTRPRTAESIAAIAMKAVIV